MQAQQTAIKHYEQGRMLHQQGKLSSAERAYKKAIKVNRNFAEAHNNLGNVLLDRGRFREAFNAYQKALKLLPQHPMILNNVGNALQLQGENEKALGWLDKAINQDPDNADAHNNRGNALWSLGKDPEAVAAYRRALELNPQLADSSTSLGLILLEQGELQDAIKCFNHALKINPTDKNAYEGLGRAQSEQGSLELAVAAYRQAIALDPANAQYYRKLGKAFSDHGEIEESIAAYREALEINPGYAEIYLALSKSRKFTQYDDDIAAMESLFARQGLARDDRTQLAFALGKAYEDLGNYDKSMEFVIEATQLKRDSYDYSIAESREQFDRIRQVFSPDFFSSHRDSGDPDRTPIFILGMPRSGTSLVEQILASHPDVYGAGELKDLGRVLASLRTSDRHRPSIIPQELLELDVKAFAGLGKQYIDRIRGYSADAKFIIDKMPGNFLRIGFIRTILPNARVIHCTRNPMDNCLSILKTHLKHSHGYANDMSELGQYYRMYLELMDYWRDTLPGFVYDQSYEDMVKSDKEQINNLLQHCGLDWNDACLDFHKTRRKVQTASNTQVRRPIYKDSVQLWKRYERQLEPLRAAIYD